MTGTEASRTSHRILREFRQIQPERSSSDVPRTLQESEQVTRAKQNSMLALADCCKAYCPFGEVAEVFRGVFRKFKEPTIF